MSKPGSADTFVSEEQLAYANWLDRGMRLGFVLLVGTYLVYLFGVVKPHVDLQELPRLWGLPADQFRQAAGVPNGWGWLRLAGTGDYMNFLGVALLSAATIPCYLRIVPIFIRNGEWVLVVMSALEVLVLVLAASGFLVGAGH